MTTDSLQDCRMPEPKKVLYIAENALSAIQGGGIVAYAVLQGLPAENLLGFYEYRNITPVPEYADRFIHLGPWRAPKLFQGINRLTKGRSCGRLHRRFAHRYVEEDLKFVDEQVTKRNFAPEVVYFAGLSYRFMRLAVTAAEHYDIPMVVLHMDDWMAYDSQNAGPWRAAWSARISEELKRGAARSLASTSNSPRLAERLTGITGYRHYAANNCCSDLMQYGDPSADASGNEVPVITYAGAMNMHLQGETLKVLASAVTELNAEGTRVHLHIYTPWEFAVHANAIAVPDAVFYKGQIGRERLADVYRRSNFLATTVTYRPGHISLFRHSLSTKLSEYLCAGKPVISMGHWDWHLHEYVQENGCGFSILMDENFSRAKIKEQLRAMLATPPEGLARIGRNNRALWERDHDVAIMAQMSRRAVGMDTTFPAETARRGALWVGQSASTWVPLEKLKAIGRRLVDVFEQSAVDIVGEGAFQYPELPRLLAYCTDIGLRPTVAPEKAVANARQHGWERAGTNWSLAPAQRSVAGTIDAPKSVFEQVYDLRGITSADSPVQRVLNQLSLRVSGHGPKPSVWMYGSAPLGLEIITAITQHAWLKDAVEIGGFLSSPGHCRADLLHGHRWLSVDALPSDAESLIVVASETSRLAIQEELSRRTLLEKSISAFGTASRRFIFERDANAPGQPWRAGATARDYAEAELAARLDAIEARATCIDAVPDTRAVPQSAA
jgi:hypothetical protein